MICDKAYYGSAGSMTAFIDVPSVPSDGSGSSDSLSYAKQASCSSSICLLDKRVINATHISDGIIPYHVDHNFNAIVFKFTEKDTIELGIKFVDGIVRIQGHVNFEADLAYFIRMHKALDDLPAAALSKIVPDSSRFGIKYELVNKMTWPPRFNEKGEKNKQLELNEEQVTALKKIESFNPALPFIVLGSFGTGKTRLLARSAYNSVCNGGRVKALLVAHHQSSADTLVQQFNRLGNYRIKILRVCKSGEWRENLDCVKFMSIDKIRDNGNFLDNYHIVITTLGISRSLLFKVIPARREGYFSHIFIDEGAQTREPEAIIPLCFAGEHTKVVIAGDHCQVIFITYN